LPQLPIAIGDPAVGDVEGVDHAVANEPMMILITRRELRIRAVAIERAGEPLRQLAAQRQIGRIGLEAYRRKISGEERLFRKRDAHDTLPSVCARIVPRKPQADRGKAAKPAVPFRKFDWAGQLSQGHGRVFAGRVRAAQALFQNAFRRTPQRHIAVISDNATTF
jgi:hypothetical protein